MKSIKTKKGVLKYRIPNFVESLRLMGESRVSLDGKTNELLILADMMEKLEPFIDYSELKEIKSYKNVLDDDELAMCVKDILQEFNEKTEKFLVGKKKTA